jgi:hypothetical protein
MTRTLNNLCLLFVENRQRLRMVIFTILLILVVSGLIFPGVAAFADGATGGTH